MLRLSSRRMANDVHLRRPLAGSRIPIDGLRAWLIRAHEQECPLAKLIELGLRIRRNEPEAWRCNCGSHSFWLYSDQRALCSNCEQEALEMNGYWRLPDSPPPQNPNRERGEIVPFSPVKSES